MDLPVLKSLCASLSLILCLAFCIETRGQNKILQGNIRDIHSSEPIPFASVQFKRSGTGKLTDSVGHFRLTLDGWPKDTLEVSYVGYEDYLLPVDGVLVAKEQNGVVNMNISLVRGKYATEVVIRRKIDRGLLMWRRIVRRKPINDRYRFQNFSYELYNKLELDFKNINKKSFGNCHCEKFQIHSRQC